MNYVNDRFCELVQLPRNRQAILAMKKDGNRENRRRFR